MKLDEIAQFDALFQDLDSVGFLQELLAIYAFFPSYDSVHLNHVSSLRCPVKLALAVLVCFIYYP